LSQLMEFFFFIIHMTNDNLSIDQHKQWWVVLPEVGNVGDDWHGMEEKAEHHHYTYVCTSNMTLSHRL